MILLVSVFCFGCFVGTLIGIAVKLPDNSNKEDKRNDS